MLILLLGSLLAASPVELASTGLRSTTENAPVARSLGNTLAQRMTETGFVKVTTPDDVAAVVGLERQRSLLGCAENACIAELAGALGVKALVSGELSKLGDVFQLTVKVLDAQSAATIFSSLERHSGEAALLSAVDRLAAAASRATALHFSLIAEKPNLAPMVGVGLGVVAAGVGGVLLGLATADDAALRAKQPATFPEAVAVKNAGQLKQGVGLGLVAGGGAVALGSLVWLLISPRVDAPVALAPAPNGVVAWGTF